MQPKTAISAAKHETSAAIVNQRDDKSHRPAGPAGPAGRALRIAVAALGISVVSCKRGAPAPSGPSVLTASAVDGDRDRGRPAPPDVGNPPADAQATPSGLRTRVLQPGTGGRQVTRDDFVEVVYTGWTRGGRFFEGTGDGERIRFDRAKLIPGLDEGIGMMVEGEKRRFWIPFALAYATQPHHVNAPQEDMTFDVELLRILPIPRVPEDVARAPSNAIKKKSGIVYRFLKHGSGTVHPATDSRDSRLNLQWSMWTPEGRRFYTSLLVKDVVQVSISALPPGMAEAAKLMVTGDKLRVWLPGKLGYGDPIPDQDQLPFAPQLGPIVVDMELFASE